MTDVPEINVGPRWEDVFDAPAAETLGRSVLPAFLQAQRWFGGKARRIDSVRIADGGLLRSGPPPTFLSLLDVDFADGTSDRYFLPMTVAAGVPLTDALRPYAIARLKGSQGEAILHDAPADNDACAELLDAIGTARELRTKRGTVRATSTAAYRDLRGDPKQRLPVERGPATSSNSLLFFGGRLLLKLFRRLEPGTNPDFEIGRFLTEGRRFDRVPAVAGAIEYRASGDDAPITLGILQAAVPNDGDGWSHALNTLRSYYERIGNAAPPAPDQRPLAELAAALPTSAASNAIGDYLRAAATLGRRTAEMHLALTSDETDPDFAPEPLTSADSEELDHEIARQGRQAFASLAENRPRLPAAVRGDAERLLRTGPAAVDSLAASDTAPPAAKIRIHGDYHLGQVLWTNGDYMILDFEGEPTRPIEERRRKFSPVRDVAGMLRSYHYAAYAALFAFTTDRPQDFPRLAPWADLWQRAVSAAFLREYLAAASGVAFLPRDPADFAALLDRFTLAKALYELNYELNNRPDWVRIPLSGVLSLLSKEA